jgi:hypothetical protein
MTVLSFQIAAEPFLRLLQFAPLSLDRRPARRQSFGRTEAGRRDLVQDSPERECSVLSVYQMGCLAQQLSIGGFDVAAGSRCRCEPSSGHCIERIR